MLILISDSDASSQIILCGRREAKSGADEGACTAGSLTDLVLSGAVDDLLLCLAHNTENQRLSLLRPVGSHAQIDPVRAGVLLEGLCRRNS